jgi:hypothetical protein
VSATVTVSWLTAFLDRPASGAGPAARFWTAVTGTELSPPRGERGQFATLRPVPGDGDAYLRLQTVRTAAGPGGGHLDVHVPDVAAGAERAVALGARATPRGGYVTLTSPAGLPWCLVPAVVAGARRPAPVERDGGVCSRADQLCLDVPPATFAAECAFWQAMTRWELRTGSRPEFAVLVRPEDIPLRLLMQRLDAEPPAGRAGCHLDLACTDVPAEVAVHEGWGARVLARFPGWTTLADPSGVPYCITRRDPVTGLVPL